MTQPYEPSHGEQMISPTGLSLDHPKDVFRFGGSQRDAREQAAAASMDVHQLARALKPTPRMIEKKRGRHPSVKKTSD